MVAAKSAAAAKAQKLLDPTSLIDAGQRVHRRAADPECNQGPIVDKTQFDKVLSFIESGKQQGARLMAGGGRSGTKVDAFARSWIRYQTAQGYFIQPTVFADVKAGPAPR